MQRNSTPRKSGQIKSQFTVPIPHLKHMYDFLKFHIKPFLERKPATRKASEITLRLGTLRRLSAFHP